MPTLADPAYVRQSHAYLRLRQHWRRDPVVYVRQRFGVEPTWQQRQILEAIAPPGSKVSVRSGHGIGKTTAAAWVVLWHLETHDYAKVPCTAPSSHQLRDILWTELSKWLRHADAQSAQRGDHPALYLSELFSLTQDRLVDVGAPDWGAFGRTARKENPEALQGFHATHLLYVIDEVSAVAEPIFEAAEGALSTPNARVLMVGNPTRTSGTFHASHHKDRGSYTALHFRSQDSPLVDPAYRPRLVKKWGDGSNVVRVRADGDFPKQEDDVLISLELTELCLLRERTQGHGPRRLGVDVAWRGSDRTTLIVRQGHVVSHIAVFAKDDTMITVGHIVQILDPWQVDEVYVDIIGLGAGVHNRLDELRRQGLITCAVIGVNVAEKAPRVPYPAEARPYLLRDYLWLEGKRWLQDEAPVFCAEDRSACEDLAGELASVRFQPNSQGLIVIEDKASIRTRLGRSSDLADGLLTTFAPAPPALPRLDMSRALQGLHTPSRGHMPGAATRPRFGRRIFADEYEDL